MKKSKLILITGGTGLMGKGLEETAPASYKILSVHQRDYAVEDSRVQHLVLDIRNQRKVDALFARRRFDAVIHAAGIASVDYVEKHYGESFESNLLGTLNITAACRRLDIPLIYISTNAVFDGNKPPYREGDPFNPLNKYGHIKVECEKLVRETLEHFTIVRPILMYGWNHPVCRPNPATWIFEKLLRGETVHLVDDVHENPLYNLQCGHALWEIIKRKPGGVFHLAGGEIVNRYEFALSLAKVFGLDKSLLVPVQSSFFPSIAPRPKNTTFDTRRMEKELGIKPLTVEEGLLSMKSRMKIKP